MSGDPFWHAITAGQLDVAAGVVAFHEGLGTKHYAGECDIVRDRNPLVRALLRMAGLPADGHRVPVRLTLITTPDGAEWQRDFGGHVTRSSMRWSASTHCVSERFGPFAVDMRFEAENGGLLVHIARLRCLGLPVPGLLRPRSETRETMDAAGRFCFDVSAHLPLLGLLIRYSGHLSPEG
ncbi:DUF4166 domain-containing protein [Roseovarius sp. 2305UL8-3]|uniref:DUF4166 domain-containing protein n=1 Tax=Roseovarius conchicola TaxID=3121636 RepID=UPI003527D8A8